jgi:hypothetical protein
MNFGTQCAFVMDTIIYDACDGYCDIYDGYCDIYVMYMFLGIFGREKQEKNIKN